MQPQRAEVNPFPNHQVGHVSICTTVDTAMLIAEEYSKQQENATIIESLAKSKTFKSLFDVLEFNDKARKVVTYAFFEISQQYGPQCFLVNHAIG